MEIKTEREAPKMAPMGENDSKKPEAMPEDKSGIRDSAQKEQKAASIMDQLAKKPS